MGDHYCAVAVAVVVVAAVVAADHGDVDAAAVAVDQMLCLALLCRMYCGLVGYSPP